ncbi:MAG: hypothetical protein IK078_10770 [Lachnospiraceae bacterium]|nr:hypothetical protein [Lachnospiraceae bacterium]
MSWDYVYEDPLEYQINTQMEKVKHESYRITSQLDSVNKRLSLIRDEGKINLMLFCGIFMVYGISFIGLQSGSVILRLICTVPYVLSLFALIFLTPVILYKMLNGFLQYWLNIHSLRYTHMMKKMGIQTYEEERRGCVRLLTKYEDYLKQLEEWKDAVAEGSFNLSEPELLSEFEKMDLSGEVPVTNAYSGKMGAFTKCMTVIMWLLPFLIAIIAVIRFSQKF